MSYETPLSFPISLGKVERGASTAFNDVTRTVIQGFMSEANKKMFCDTAKCQVETFAGRLTADIPQYIANQQKFDQRI